MLLSDAGFGFAAADEQPNFRLFVRKVLNERGDQRDRLFEPFGSDNAFAVVFGPKLFANRQRIFGPRHSRIEKDRDLQVVLSRVLTDDKVTRASRRLPINVPKIIRRLIITQRQQVLSLAAFVHGKSACAEHLGFHFRRKRRGGRKYEKLGFFCRKPPPMAKESERKAGRKFEIFDHKTAAAGENMFTFAFNRRHSRNAHKITECAAHQRRFAEPFGNKSGQNGTEFFRRGGRFAFGSANFGNDRIARKKAFAVIEAYEYRRAFAREYRFGKTHSDIELFQTNAARKKADGKGRRKQRKY